MRVMTFSFMGFPSTTCGASLHGEVLIGPHVAPHVADDEGPERTRLLGYRPHDGRLPVGERPVQRGGASSRWIPAALILRS